MTADFLSALLAGQSGTNPYASMLYRTSESPLAMAAQGISAASPALYNPFASTGKNFATAGLSGLASALLAGVAANTTQSKNEALVEQAITMQESDSATARAMAKANPRLAPLYGQLAAQEKEAEKARLKAEMEMPKTRDVVIGGEKVTQQWDPASRQFVEVGRGPRWDPSGGAVGQLASVLAANQLGQAGGTPEGQSIVANVPKGLQSKAVTELGSVEEFERTKTGLQGLFKEAKEIPSKTALIPRTTDNAKMSAITSGILVGVQANWKGPMSDRDLAVVQKLTPDALDTKERIEEKEKQLLNLVERNRKATPTLQNFGVQREAAEKPKTGQAGVMEGQTATHPQTGQKLIFKNGQWGPM